MYMKVKQILSVAKRWPLKVTLGFIVPLDGTNTEVSNAENPQKFR